jgi:hypothetical protein
LALAEVSVFGNPSKYRIQLVVDLEVWHQFKQHNDGDSCVKYGKKRGRLEKQTVKSVEHQYSKQVHN